MLKGYAGVYGTLGYFGHLVTELGGGIPCIFAWGNLWETFGNLVLIKEYSVLI
jgi:hypothetical protein